MSAVVKGLRVHRSAALASGSAQYRHFVSSPYLGNPTEAAATTTTTPEAAAAEVAAKKTSRAVYWFIGVAAAAVLGTLAYPQLVTLPPQKPAPLPPPPILPPPNVVDPSPAPKPALSPREELKQRVSNLRSELAELRKEKESQLVNMKKRAIKDDINLIESGLKKLDKA